MLSSSRLNLVNDKRIKLERNSVSIVETEKGGAGTVIFTKNGDMISVQFKPGQHVHWLKNQKCSDGAIIVESGSDIQCHVVELKTTLSAKEWAKAQAQFAGMVANLYAVLGVLDLPDFSSLRCHISYIKETITASAAASPVLSKLPIGTPANSPAALSWSGLSIKVLEHDNIPVNPVPRDPATGLATVAI